MPAAANSLFQFRQGDHLCVFHRSLDSLMQVLSPYIAEGLRNGERCFCVQREDVVKRLEYDLRFIGVDMDDAVRRGALEFRTLEQAYLPDGSFEPRTMMDMLIRSIEESVRKGFSGFRSAGDLSWAVEGRDECRQIVGYEKMVEECFPGKPAIGMCQYPIQSFRPDVLESVLGLHRQQIVDPKTPSSHASLCVNSDHCVTEIVTDKFVVNPKYYYVVGKRDYSDIVGWGTAPNFDVAALRAEHLVRHRAKRPLPN
jgi:hypothetical protein